MLFFTSVFSIKTSCPQDTQLLELEAGDWEMSEAPIIQEEMVSDLLCQLHPYKSVSPPENNEGTAKNLPNHFQSSASSPGVLASPKMVLISVAVKSAILDSG